MAEEIKVAEVQKAFEEPKVEPKVDVPKENDREKARHNLEEQVQKDTLAPLPPEKKEEVKEPPKEESVKEPDDLAGEIAKKIRSRYAEKIEKRVDKEVAKRKTLEEELQETRQELERVKAEPRSDIKPAEKGKDIEITDEQIGTALSKAREDGDTKFEIEILNFIAERRANSIKDKTLTEIRSQEQAQRQQRVEQERAWVDLITEIGRAHV